MRTILDVLAMGQACLQAGRVQEAEQIFRRIVELQPDCGQAWHSLGAVALQEEDLPRAARCFARALELMPESAEVHHALGVAFHAQGNLPAAVPCYRRALELRPDYPEANSNLANALAAEGKLDEALLACRRALALNPDSADTHNSLGNIFMLQGKRDEAAPCYQRALELNPNHVVAHVNLGNALSAQGSFSDAVACYCRAVELQPLYADAHFNLGLARLAQGLPDDAAASFLRAQEINPNNAFAWNGLGYAFRHQAKLSEAIACYRRACELNPDFAVAHSNLVYTLYFCPGYDAAAIAAEHRQWNERHAQPLAKFIQPHANPPSPDRRLRIGYVSPDFRTHVLAYFMVPLFERHDHQQFEIVLYSGVEHPDDITQRLRATADVWREIVTLTDEQVAKLIRQDQIDILVDLTMHMGGGRPLVFARKPAPVQVCWLAYPGTTGISAMDYRLTDPYLDPPGLFDADCSEQSIRLPDTFWCYDPLTSDVAVGALPASAQGHVTFGNLNNFCKFNVGVARLHARVLAACE